MSENTGGKRQQVMEAMEEVYQEDVLPFRLSQNYRIFSCLKYSAAKKVYVLEEKNSHIKYVLKCRTEDDMELLKKEYEILTSLEGTFAPKAYDYFTEQGVSFLLREYITGETLEQKVEKKGVYDVKQAMDTMLSVCDCVKALHSHTPVLIHRDLKPQNILITERGSCKIFDMDTVREYKEESSRDTVYLGSRGTAAPEQFGFGQTSIRTDIYSLGILFLFLLTGRYTVDCPEWKELPGYVQSTILKCLSMDSGHRYPSVDALIRELKCMRRFSKRRSTIVYMSGLFLLGVLLLGLVLNFIIDRVQYYNQAVVFQNPRIEAAVRQTLGVDADVPIYPSDLEQITTLILCDDQIFQSIEEHEAWHDNYYNEYNRQEKRETKQDFSDLQYFTELHTLVLDNQGIDNLQCLEGLPLYELSLRKNHIRDLSGIADYEKLTVLILDDNPISVLSPVKGMENLRQLSVSGTNIQSLEAIRGMELTSFICSNTNVRDYSVLATLEHLSELQISGADSEEIAYLYSLKNLSILGLFDSHLESLEELSEFGQLSCLDVGAGSQIDSLTGITNFSNLEYLGIAETGIRDIEGLQEVPSLTMLDITDTPLQSLQPLKECRNLEMIFIDSGKEQAIAELSLNEDIRIIVTR